MDDYGNTDISQNAGALKQNPCTGIQCKLYNTTVGWCRGYDLK